MAEWNLKVGAICDSNGNETGDVDINAVNYGLQDKTMKGWVSGQERKGTVIFSRYGYWDDTYTPQGSSSYPWVYNNKSNLYQYVESYKTLLGNTDKVSEVSLASYEDINALLYISNYTWLYSTSFWLGSANSSSSFYVWSMNTYGNLNFSNCSADGTYGVRPVITIDTSKI